MSDLPILPPLHEWHPVPVGAIIPAKMPYMVRPAADEFRAYLTGHSHDITLEDGYEPRWTPEPIAPPLPTKEGAQILARFAGNGNYFLLTRTSTGWARGRSSASTYFDSDILEWALLPADLVWHTR